MASPLLFPLSPPTEKPLLSSLSSSPFVSPPASLSRRKHSISLNAVSLTSLPEQQSTLLDLFQASPPTWKSAIGSNLVIFVLGSPILVTGLSISGIVAAFLLGTVTWRAFGSSGFILVASYFVLIARKEAMGIAERRGGRRGPGSVIGSGTAGILCALMTLFGIGRQTFARLWLLGFVASCSTKLSDTASSEVGEAYGKTA